MTLWVGGGLDRINGQHFFPNCLASGDLQGVEGVTVLYLFQPVLVLLIDLGNGCTDGLASAIVLSGEKDSKTGPCHQTNEADH